MERYSYSIAPEKENPKYCAWEGCSCEGIYPAPRAKESRHYLWFCLEHVRQYNKSWDFFQGMSAEEIEAFRKDSVHGHRPTWKRGLDTHIHYTNQGEKIMDGVNSFLNGDTPEIKTPPVQPEPLPRKEREHLAILGLSYPVTLKEIKKRYKELVKRYHPDINPNDNSLEDRFKVISQAYQMLRKSVYFPS